MNTADQDLQENGYPYPVHDWEFPPAHTHITDNEYRFAMIALVSFVVLLLGAMLTAILTDKN